MVALQRMRVQITGSAVVGPSVSTFYFTVGATGTCAAVRAMYLALQPQLPTTTTFTVQSSGDTIEPSNGTLVGTWSETPVAAVTGTDGTGPIDGVGARVKWVTNGIHFGRRVRGATFFVPLGRGAMSANGQPDGTTQAAFQTAASNFVTAVNPNFVIWGRPHKGGSDGLAFIVTSALASPEVSWLRSRRT